jgi:hypothetical protein
MSEAVTSAPFVGSPISVARPVSPACLPSAVRRNPPDGPAGARRHGGVRRPGRGATARPGCDSAAGVRQHNRSATAPAGAPRSWRRAPSRASTPRPTGAAAPQPARQRGRGATARPKCDGTHRRTPFTASHTKPSRHTPPNRCGSPTTCVTARPECDGAARAAPPAHPVHGVAHQAEPAHPVQQVRQPHNLRDGTAGVRRHSQGATAQLTSPRFLGGSVTGIRRSLGAPRDAHFPGRSRRFDRAPARRRCQARSA